MLKSPTQQFSNQRPFLWRMTVFLIFTAIICAILYPQIRSAFLANPGLNGLIIGTLVIGIIFVFRMIVRLFPEIQWVNNFRIADPGLEIANLPILLAPMAIMLRERTGKMSLTTPAMRSILDSIATRLDESREVSRYLIGLMVFLGLLGTFWGLLDTITSVGQMIIALDPDVTDSGMFFEDLQEGLIAPLSGMGTAFSSSLLGLGGSLILGFLDLQAGQAQNRFYIDLEDWLSTVTDLESAEHGQNNDLKSSNNATLGMVVSMDNMLHSMNTALQKVAESTQIAAQSMQCEQKIIHEWLKEQTHEQIQMRNILQEITDKLSSRSAND